MDVDTLVIEVTRKCNMECEHCLRGGAENLDMDMGYVKSLFQKIDYISTLTLTGGEPSLAWKVIDNVVVAAQTHEVEIGGFYIATNAKHIPDEFLLTLVKLYSYCTDNEMSAVEWSNDEYHEGEYPESIKRLQTFSFAHPKYNGNGRGGLSIIAEGNAENWGERNNSRESFEIETWDGRTNIQEGNLYLNCEGNVIAGCDWSYESQRSGGGCVICPVEEFCAEKVEQWVEEGEEGE